MASPAQQPLFPLSAFHLPDGIRTHVCSAAESAPLRSQQDAFSAYLADKASAARGGRSRMEAEIDTVWRMIARAWGGVGSGGDGDGDGDDPSSFDEDEMMKNVGFVPSVADGVSAVLESLDWRPGDNVVLDCDDFPSVVAPFQVRVTAAAAQRTEGGGHVGVVVPEIRFHDATPPSQSVAADEEEDATYPRRSSSSSSNTSLADVVDANTRLIAISYVSYLHGSRADLAEYRAVADSVGALLLVDFTQAAGCLSVDARVADFAFSSCYKFLLGTTGCAVAWWNRQRFPGWAGTGSAGGYSVVGAEMKQDAEGRKTMQFRVKKDAMGFCRGTPAFLSIYMLRMGLEFLSQWEPREIERHVQALTESLMEGLDKEKVMYWTPKEKGKHAASVMVKCERAAEIVERMNDEAMGVYAWNGNGRIRFSFHGYNCLEDVTRILEVFPRLWREYNPNT